VSPKTRFCVLKEELLAAKNKLFREEEPAANTPIYKIKINIFQDKIPNYFKLHTFVTCFYFGDRRFYTAS